MTFGIDLTSLSRPGGISDWRLSRGLLHGLVQTAGELSEDISYAAWDPDEVARVIPDARVSTARPGPRALHNSFAFRRAFAELSSDDVGLYFHFPPARARHHVAVYVPDIIPVRAGCAFSWRVRQYYRLQRPLVRLSDATILTISQSERAAIVDAGYAAPENVHVIRLGLDSPWESTERGGVSSDRSIRPQPPFGTESEPYGLVVGRLTPRKNVDRLLEAWSLLSTPPALVFAGPCESSKLRRRIELHPRASYVGHVAADQLEALFDGAAVVLNASLAEGFGLPVAEALARQKRVVLSDLPSFREIVDVAGAECEFFEPRDPHSIASAVERGLRSEPPGEGVSTALRHRFNWRNTAIDVVQALRQVTCADR